MRIIDRYLGVPSCWILSGIFRLFPVKRRGLHPENVKNILVVKFFGLGSIILSTASLSMLRNRFPGASITFLSFAANRELLLRIPLVHNVVTVDTSSPWTFSRDVFRLIRMLAVSNFDIVFDFEFFSKFSTMLGALSRAPYRVGFHLPALWRSRLLTHSVPLATNRHVKEAFCSQIQELLGDTIAGECTPPLILTHDVISLDRKRTIVGQPIIVVNVNSGDTFLERRWSPERFAELIVHLSLDGGFAFVLTGTKSERAYVQKVIEHAAIPERCWNAAGLLTIPEFGALLQRCSLMLSNDSGPLHLAAALGATTVGLFGPESPDFYGPLGSAASSLYKKMPCSPCMNVYSAKSFRCPHDAQCMKNISVDDVIQVIEEVLAVA
jgi:ADP-heptose:LPS heptosyltransferase